MMAMNICVSDQRKSKIKKSVFALTIRHFAWKMAESKWMPEFIFQKLLLYRLSAILNLDH